MKFIEIKSGLSIRIDEIEAIGVGESPMVSKVYTHHTTYDSTFPYSVLLELLENSLKEGNIEQQELNIMKEFGTFAG